MIRRKNNMGLNPFRSSIPQRPQRQPRDDCEIEVVRKGDKIKKRIKGNCSKEQLKALAGEGEDLT
jgi:hypothetical protein